MLTEKPTPIYSIHLHGHLDERRLRWFEGLDITLLSNGETVIQGAMDQSALYGILDRIRDLGLELIAVRRVSDEIRNQE